MESEAQLDAEETQAERRATENCKKQCRRGTAYQMMACLIANTSVIGPAMGLGYSAVALGPLAAPESEIKATEGELSWIASIIAIATPLGCILSSVSMRRGRRFAMMAISVTSATGWLVIYLAPNVIHILVGRAICGIAMGLASVPATVYAAEVAAPKLRGIVVTWTSVSIATGILIVYVFGCIFQTNWRLVALISGLFPVLSIILVASKMPESPVWLRSAGRGPEADEVLRHFSGNREGETAEYLVAAELSSINTQQQQQQRRSEGIDFSSRGSLLTRENLKPFVIMLGFFFFQQFSGIFVVIYYAVDFALEAGVRMDPHLAAILIGFTRLLGTVAVSYISRRYGRRIPSITSGAGMTLFMGILAGYLWADGRGFRLNDRGLIPAVSITMYILTSTMGFLVLPFAMIGEIYPARVKDLFSGITTCFAYVFSFFVLKVYPDMLRAFGKHGVFMFYGIMSMLGTIFVAIFLPETKGKTLDEIEEIFRKKNNRNNRSGEDGGKLDANDKELEELNGEVKIADCSAAEMKITKTDAEDEY